jgi:basic membrane protein A
MLQKYKIAVAASVAIAVVLISVVAYIYFLGPTTPGSDVLKIAFVHESPSGDNFFMGAYKGILDASTQVEFEYHISDSVSVADAERVFRDYAENGYDVIFGHAFAYMDAMVAVAADYPDTIFLHLEGYKTAPNLAVYDWKPHEPSYLLGMLAASLTKTGKVGTIGLVAVPTMIREVEAFRLGAKEIDPNVKVGFIYTGSWYDPSKEEEATRALIEAGADALYQMGAGGFAVCEQEGVYVMGSMVDTYELAPSVHVTSFEWNLATFIVKVVNEVKAGTWQTGIYKWGFAEGVFTLTPYHDLEDSIPQSVKDTINAKTNAITNGTFEVPEITEVTSTSEL